MKTDTQVSSKGTMSMTVNAVVITSAVFHVSIREITTVLAFPVWLRNAPHNIRYLIALFEEMAQPYWRKNVTGDVLLELPRSTSMSLCLQLKM